MGLHRQEGTTTEQALLSLLQISDSFFPTGAFTQSYGLETFVQEGLVTSKEALAEFLTTYLLDNLATSDCLAMLLAYRVGAVADWTAVVQLDQRLAAQKLARESREASHKTGRRMLQVVQRLFPGSGLDKFAELIREGRAQGHHAVVFGLVTATLGLGEKEAALAFAYNATAGMVNNAVRLIPLGQHEGQWVLTTLSGVIQQAVKISLGLGLDDLGSTAPATEIRAMQHEHLYSRLFMS
ncbi:MAG TPA: urease accessory protein UreF [Bacillota bacterium]|nr:urease accessory protein UreF [Bacillota bacterium]